MASPGQLAALVAAPHVAPGVFQVPGFWTCPAQARKVDDSGEGVIMLVSGGDAGLRLQPGGAPAAWSLTNPAQWGEPFLLIADPEDLR